MSVVIIDYGMGNVASVQKSLSFLNIDSVISNKNSDIEQAKYIILPGVGSFKQGMDNLRKSNLIDLLNNEVMEKKKPFLGICLGMQLIVSTGTEPEICDGLGWIKGKVIKMIEPNKRVPHLGWNNIQTNGEGFWKASDEKDFYFIHSYHVVPEDDSNIAARVNYGNDYVAAIQQDNIFATQFHPEKSQQAGLTILTHFFQHHA